MRALAANERDLRLVDVLEAQHVAAPGFFVHSSLSLLPFPVRDYGALLRPYRSCMEAVRPRQEILRYRAPPGVPELQNSE